MLISRGPAVVVLSAALLAIPVAATATTSATRAHGQQKPGHSRFAVIGDVPYGGAEIAAFPSKVDRINAEPDLGFTVHVGDIKNGSSPCTDDYNAMIRAQFDRFVTPLVYTPGDNEWTDCHRPAAGRHNPLERLDAVRRTFYPMPGQTLGVKPMKVDSQAAQGFPENVSFRSQGLSIAALHVVGSNNDLVPWSGIGETTPTPGQLAEERARMDSSIDLVHKTFAVARQKHDRAVVLFQQADMFDPTFTPTPEGSSAFNRLVQAIVDESESFEGEVYLFDGDSHRYNVDRPLESGSTWLAFYGVHGSADNLTRVTVDGEAYATNFLEVTVNRPGTDHVLSWRRIPYAS